MKMRFQLPFGAGWALREFIRAPWFLLATAALCSVLLLTAYVKVLRDGVARGSQWKPFVAAAPPAAAKLPQRLSQADGR